MYVKFNDEDIFRRVISYGINPFLINLFGPEIIEDFSGFKLYKDDKETVEKDCSEYIYKWNIYTEYPDGGCIYTNDQNLKEPDPKTVVMEETVDPLNDSQLTEVVADLMYEVDMIKLGIS